MTTPEHAIMAGMGPLPASLPTPTGTAPLSASGVLNLSALGTTPKKVLSGDEGKRAKSRKLKVLVLTSGRYVGWHKQTTGTADPTTITADAAGTATNASLVSSGEWFMIPGNLDVWLVASGASTVVQVHVEEV